MGFCFRFSFIIQAILNFIGSSFVDSSKVSFNFFNKKILREKMFYDIHEILLWATKMNPLVYIFIIYMLHFEID